MIKINGSTPLVLSQYGRIGVVGQPATGNMARDMASLAMTQAFSFLGGQARADQFSLDSLRNGEIPEASDRPYGNSATLEWRDGMVVLTTTACPSEGSDGEWYYEEPESETLSLEEFLRRNDFEFA